MGAIESMSSSLSLLICVLIASFSACIRPANEDALLAPRKITIDVHLVDHQGHPIVDAPLFATGRDEAVTGYTDADGNCKLAGTFDDADGRVLVAVVATMAAEGNRFRRDVLREKELKSTYALRDFYVVPLQQDVEAYRLTITAHEAVKVRGRLVDERGAPVQGLVSGFDRRFRIIGSDGRFELPDVRKGADAELLFSQEGVDAIRWVRMDAQQTTQDVDLGDVTMPKLPQGTPIDLTVTNDDKVWQELCGMENEVSLVSADATTMLQVFVNDLGRAAVDRENAAKPLVPPGEYYLIAGPLQGSRIAGQLVDLLRSQRHAELISNGAPRITVTTGAQAPVEFDALKAERVVRLLAGD